MSVLNPWQLLVWIAGLELISVPLIIFMINAIVIGYFKAKESHAAKMMNALGAAFEKVGNDILTLKTKEEHNEH